VHEVELNVASGSNMLSENNLLIGNKILDLTTMMRKMALKQQMNGVMKHCGFLPNKYPLLFHHSHAP